MKTKKRTFANATIFLPEDMVIELRKFSSYVMKGYRIILTKKGIEYLNVLFLVFILIFLFIRY